MDNLNTPYSADICIIGAGPGGCSASIYLSNAGVKHLIIDKAKFPRDKICGDACSGKVVDAFKKLGIQHDYRADQLGSWGVTFVAPNGKVLRVPFQPEIDKNQHPPGFISKRFDFDYFLIEKVKARNEAQLIENLETRTYEYKDAQWLCFDKQKNLVVKAKFLIVADGAQSSFSRHVANLEVESKHNAAGIRAYYSNVSGLDEDNFIELHFLKKFIPGYLWIFPLPDNQANVGVGLRSDLVKKRKLDLKKVLFELIQEHPALKDRFKSAELNGKVRGWGLPFGSKKRKLHGQNYVLTGDAASLIDPFTGEGIGNAMISGMAAAEVVTNALKTGNSSLAKYDELVYGQLGQELQLSTKLQQLATQKRLFNWLINKATTNETLSHTISCMFMDLDIREKLKDPTFYFKLLFN